MRLGSIFYQVREQQNRKLGIETKFARWKKESLKKKVMKMAEDDEALKLASKEDKDNTVLRKKFRLKKNEVRGSPSNNGQTTKHCKMIRGHLQKGKTELPMNNGRSQNSTTRKRDRNTNTD